MSCEAARSPTVKFCYPRQFLRTGIIKPHLVPRSPFTVSAQHFNISVAVGIQIHDLEPSALAFKAHPVPNHFTPEDYPPALIADLYLVMIIAQRFNRVELEDISRTLRPDLLPDSRDEFKLTQGLRG